MVILYRGEEGDPATDAGQAALRRFDDGSREPDLRDPAGNQAGPGDRPLRRDGHAVRRARLGSRAAARRAGHRPDPRLLAGLGRARSNPEPQCAGPRASPRPARRAQPGPERPSTVRCACAYPTGSGRSSAASPASHRDARDAPARSARRPPSSASDRLEDDWLGELGGREARARRARLIGRRAPASSRTGKIVCVGLNYREHVAEGGRAAAGPAAALRQVRQRRHRRRRPDRPAGGHARARPRGRARRRDRVDRHRVRREHALDHVAGYVVVNDVSARDWQGTAALREGEVGDGQWLRAKGSDTFLPVGPVLVDPGRAPTRSASAPLVAHPGRRAGRRARRS